MGKHFEEAMLAHSKAPTTNTSTLIARPVDGWMNKTTLTLS